MPTYIDPSPSVIATKQLQAIPFGNLIGAPLDAAIRAQANAAMSAVDFIRAVGLQEGEDGHLEAVNVTFTYQDSNTGITRNLIVPLLTILPLPLIAVDDISINFTANIQAESSLSQSSTLQTAFSASTKVNVSWWFVKAEFNASYSSKRDSVATRDSKYSVEYTMDVRVHASQADQPSGLSEILNHLTRAVATRSPQGELIASAREKPMLEVGDTLKVNVVAVDGNGRAQPKLEVEATSADPATLEVDTSPVETDDYGMATFDVTVKAVPDAPKSVDVTFVWDNAPNPDITDVFSVDVG